MAQVKSAVCSMPECGFPWCLRTLMAGLAYRDTPTTKAQNCKKSSQNTKSGFARVQVLRYFTEFYILSPCTERAKTAIELFRVLGAVDAEIFSPSSTFYSTEFFAIDF